MSWKTKTTLVVALIALFSMCGADVCYMGQQIDPSGEIRWVLPYPKRIRCRCTKILFGGVNTVAPPGAEEFFYTDTPLLFVNNHDTDELQALLGCEGTQDITNSEEATSRAEQDQEKTTVGRLTTEEVIKAAKSSSAQDHEKITPKEGQVPTSKFEQDQGKTTVGQLTTDGAAATSKSEQDQDKTVGHLTTEKGEAATGRSEQDQGKTTAGHQLTTEEAEVATSKSEQGQEKTTVGQRTTDCETAIFKSEQDQEKTVGHLTTEESQVTTSKSEQDQEKTTVGQRTTDGEAATSKSEQDQEKTVGQLTTEEIEAATSRSEQDQKKTTVGQLTTEESESTTSRCKHDQEWSTVEQPTTEEECMNPLGMESGNIPDCAITASSYYNAGRYPWFGRLNNNKTWGSKGPGIDSAPWFQVDLGSPMNVYGIVTQGYRTTNHPHWVARFKVKTGMSSTSLSYIKNENRQPKVFNANTDDGSSNPVTIVFPSLLQATRIIRIEPIRAKCVRRGSITSKCLLRFEVLGCNV